MNIDCPFCGALHSLNLLKIIGEFSECTCGAIYLLDTVKHLRGRLAIKALLAKQYDAKDLRKGIFIDSGIVREYGKNNVVALAWTRRVPTIDDVRNCIHVETGDFLNEHCGCGGQYKVTGIFKIDTMEKCICYACEFYDANEMLQLHESGNFTV